MKIRNAVLPFLSIALAFGWPANVFAQQTKVVELVASDGGSKIASIHLNDQNLLFESGDTSTSLFFTADALITINHQDKSYKVLRYDALQAMTGRKAGEIAKPQERIARGPDVEFMLTGEEDERRQARS
jgi:hypothetical protein